ncbi:MAG: MBL fold metallo-hydrolase, partial [Verrucomicrobiia bacterium]
MTELRITFLGTGTSVGVPMIGCDCEVCRSDDPRDKRLRASVLISYGGHNLVIDTGPDFRTQCLRVGLKRLDAVIYTHAHTDHVMGFDDLRRFCAGPPGKIRVYGSAETLTDLERIYHFAFNGTAQFPGYTRPDPRVISGEFECCGLSV